MSISDSEGASDARTIRDLARDLVRLASTDPAALLARVKTLTPRQQAELALRLPAKQRMQLLLLAPNPTELVHQLPPAELHLTVRDMGPQDAMPLIAHASAEQLNHVVDLESWRIDRFDPERAGAWIALALESGEETLVRLVEAADDEFIVLLLQSWLGVTKLEFDDQVDSAGHGQAESGDERGFITPDGDYRFNPPNPEHAPAAAAFLRKFYVDFPERYRLAMDQACWQLPSEVEALALKWRQSRLEEQGYPGWDEAHSIYGSPQDLPVLPAILEADSQRISAGRMALRLPHEQSVLSAAIERLDGKEQERVLQETAAVTHRVLVADELDTGDREAHRLALEKVAGMLQIAFERGGALEPMLAAERLKQRTVIDLFRDGYDPIHRAAARLHAMLTEGWASRHPKMLDLLDWPIRPRLEALKKRPPLYYAYSEIDQTEERRSFLLSEEVAEAEVAVEMAEILGALFFDGLGVNPEALFDSEATGDADPIRFSQLLLTALAWRTTQGVDSSAPLPAKLFREFLGSFVSRRLAPPEMLERAFETMIGNWSKQFSMSPREEELLQGFGRFALIQLREQCASLDLDRSIEARHITCILLDFKEC